MSIQTVPLSSLKPPTANPRSIFETDALDGLAESIKSDGLLQNLVVVPVRGKKTQYRIVSGERRFRALSLLRERGEIAEDFNVPVEVRSGLSKDDVLRVATVENVQREDLPPLDQAVAFAQLLRKGATLDDLAVRTGLTSRTIKRRLALNALCDEAKAAVATGTLSLSQAEALTLGSDEAQRHILGEIESGYDCSADGIREHFIDGRPSIAIAVFPLDQYTGTITTDLFQADETSYFDDVDQFWSLQETAVEELAEEHRKAAEWVDITRSYRIPDWQYDEAEEGQTFGVLINLAPNGSVEVREGLVKKIDDEDTAEELAEEVIAEKKPRPAYSVPLCRYIGWHKSVAVQELLLSDPRKAREVAVVRALIELIPHESVRKLAHSPAPQTSYIVIESYAALFVKALGLDGDGDDLAWERLTADRFDPVPIYEAVKNLSDHELEQLLLLTAVLPFGQSSCEWLDTEDSLFNSVAGDLEVSMRSHWSPDADFLSRRTRDQLVTIAEECGFSDGRGNLHKWKKTELVNGLLRHFTDAKSAPEPTKSQQKAREWLPEAMHFPAVNPDTNAS